jgi:outer membrane protein TolC
MFKGMSTRQPSIPSRPLDSSASPQRERHHASLRRAAVLLGLAVTSCASGLLSGCAREPVDPFDPTRIAEIQRKASEGQMTQELSALPEAYRPWETRRQREAAAATQPAPTTLPIVMGNEPVVSMTLEAAIRRAVANNLEVKVAGFGPAIEATRVLEAQARFDPTFFSNAGVDVTNRQTAGSFIQDPANNFAGQLQTENQVTQYTAASGIRQILQGGGQIETRYQLRRTDQNPTSFNIDPSSEADLVLQLTQPLLRDFGGQVNSARIDISRNNQRVSLLDFRAAVEEAVANVEDTYWQLVAAQQDVQITERLLERTIRTADIIAVRMENDATKLQLAQAQADANTRKAALYRAQARVRDLSDRLKQLINDPELPMSGPTLIFAESKPVEQPLRFDYLDLLNSATTYRIELAQQQLRTNNATITLGAAKNNLLPQLNFVGSINPSGLDDDFRSAIDNQNEYNNLSYALGLQFEIPIGNREARAIYRRSLLQRQQSITQYQSLVNQVSEEVRTRAREVDTAWVDVINFRNARFAQEQALRAIQAQEDAAEPLTPFFVRNKLDTQARLAESEALEVRSLSTYNIAIAQLERAKGTLLRYNNISLEENGTVSQLRRR